MVAAEANLWHYLAGLILQWVRTAVDSDALLEKVKELRGQLADGNKATPEFLHSVFKGMPAGGSDSVCGPPQ